MENGELRIVIFLILVINLFALNLPKQFEANFTQYIYSKNQKLTYKGFIIFKNNEIYWQYNYPSIKKIWIKNKVYIYEPDLMQVTISKKPKLNLIKILKNAKRLNKDLYVTYNGNKEVYFIYDKYLKKVWYTNNLGNKIEIYFQKLKNPIKIPPLKFPKDVDFIYEN